MGGSNVITDTIRDAGRSARRSVGLPVQADERAAQDALRREQQAAEERAREQQRRLQEQAQAEQRRLAQEAQAFARQQAAEAAAREEAERQRLEEMRQAEEEVREQEEDRMETSRRRRLAAGLAEGPSLFDVLGAGQTASRRTTLGRPGIGGGML